MALKAIINSALNFNDLWLANSGGGKRFDLDAGVNKACELAPSTSSKMEVGYMKL